MSRLPSPSSLFAPFSQCVSLPRSFFVLSSKIVTFSPRGPSLCPTPHFPAALVVRSLLVLLCLPAKFHSISLHLFPCIISLWPPLHPFFFFLEDFIPLFPVVSLLVLKLSGPVVLHSGLVYAISDWPNRCVWSSVSLHFPFLCPIFSEGLSPFVCHRFLGYRACVRHSRQKRVAEVASSWTSLQGSGTRQSWKGYLEPI